MDNSRLHQYAYTNYTPVPYINRFGIQINDGVQLPNISVQQVQPRTIIRSNLQNKMNKY